MSIIGKENGPCDREIPMEIHGVPLPNGYRKYLKNSNGGTYTVHYLDKQHRLVLFDLKSAENEELAYNRFPLNLAYDIYWSYENIARDVYTGEMKEYAGGITVNSGRPIVDVLCYYRAFFRCHIPVGYPVEEEYGDPDMMIALRQDDKVVLVNDGDLIWMGEFKFKEKQYIKGKLYAGGYRTPLGAMFGEDIIPWEELEGEIEPDYKTECERPCFWVGNSIEDALWTAVLYVVVND